MKYVKLGSLAVRLVGGVSLLAAATASMPAFAQDAGAVDQATEEATEEGEIVVTGQFLNTGASSATKLDIAVIDTPFTVSSYNENFLKAIETTGVSDLYRYMAGVQRAGNTAYDVTIRGFKNGGGDRNSIVTDGMPGLAVRFGSPPTIGVQSVEVVKGPTSVLYGQAQPGGFINIISKKPQSTQQGEFNVRLNTGIGDFDRARALYGAFDITGPIDAAGTLLYRVVGEVGDAKGFRDFSQDHPVYIAPSLKWNIGPNTTLLLQGEYRKTRAHQSQNLVVTNRKITTIAPFTTQYQSRFDYQIDKGTVGSAMFEHEFSKALKFNVNYRYVDHFDSTFGYENNGATYTGTGPTAVATGLQSRRARGQENIRTYNFVDASFSAEFETLGLRHQMIFGGNMGTEVSDFNRSQFFSPGANGTAARTGGGPLGILPTTASPTLHINLLNPVHNELPLSSYPLCNITVPSQLTTTAQPFTITSPDGTTRTVTLTRAQYPTFGVNEAECSLPGSGLQWRVTTQKSKAVFVSDVISIGEFAKVLLGLRYANEKQELVEKRVANSFFPTKNDSSWLPMAGLVIKPKENISLYTSYSTSFVQVAPNTQDVNGNNPFPPTKAKSIEFGLKADLFDKRLNITTAYFDIKKQNTLNTTTSANDPTCPASVGTCSFPIGGERSKGYELEVSANPIDGWSMSMGYTHTAARISKSNVRGLNDAGVLVNIQEGARLTNAPDDTFNLWTRYDFQDGPLNGLGVGVGVAYVGDRVGYLPVATLPTGVANRVDELLTMPSFTLVDLGLYYKASENMNFTLKVANLFDKRYVESTGFSGDFQMLPGQPRLMTFSARFSF